MLLRFQNKALNFSFFRKANVMKLEYFAEISGKKIGPQRQDSFSQSPDYTRDYEEQRKRAAENRLYPSSSRCVCNKIRFFAKVAFAKLLFQLIHNPGAFGRHTPHHVQCTISLMITIFVQRKPQGNLIYPQTCVRKTYVEVEKGPGDEAISQIELSQEKWHKANVLQGDSLFRVLSRVCNRKQNQTLTM